MKKNIAAPLPAPADLGIVSKAVVSTLGTATGETEEALEMLHIPDPVGHFILVALPNMRERTERGIIIPIATNERERAASVIGKVIALGPDAYVDPKPRLPDDIPPGTPIMVVAARPRFPSGPWCKVGDNILFSRYGGKRFLCDGVEFRMLADDEVIATIPDGAKVGGL